MLLGPGQSILDSGGTIILENASKLLPICLHHSALIKMTCGFKEISIVAMELGGDQAHMQLGDVQA